MEGLKTEPREVDTLGTHAPKKAAFLEQRQVSELKGLDPVPAY